MVDYVKQAATAKRLIEANGRTVTLVRKNRTPADAAKPWRAPASPVDSTVASPIGVIYPMEEKDENGTVFRTGKSQLLLAHDSLSPTQNLDDIDHVLDGTTKYKVLEANVIKPGTVTVVYEFILKR